MFISDYLSKDFPTFSFNDDVEEAFLTAMDFRFSHIFIVEKETFLGALSIDILQERKGNLAQFQKDIEKFALLESESLVDSVSLFHRFESNVLPIINTEENYVGYMVADDIFNEMSKSPMFSENGAVLIIQNHHLHYSLGEITQIVESNNAKIFGCFVSEVFGDFVHITLKMTAYNLDFIRADLNRYGYEIVHQYYQDEKQEMLKDRLAFVQKYLEY